MRSFLVIVVGLVVLGSVLPRHPELSRHAQAPVVAPQEAIKDGQQDEIRAYQERFAKAQDYISGYSDKLVRLAREDRIRNEAREQELTMLKEKNSGKVEQIREFWDGFDQKRRENNITVKFGEEKE